MARVVANNKKEQDDIAKLLADQRNQPAYVDEGPVTTATPNIDRLRSKSRQRRQAEAAQVQQAGQAE